MSTYTYPCDPFFSPPGFVHHSGAHKVPVYIISPNVEPGVYETFTSMGVNAKIVAVGESGRRLKATLMFIDGRRLDEKEYSIDSDEWYTHYSYLLLGEEPGEYFLVADVQNASSGELLSRAIQPVLWCGAGAPIIDLGTEFEQIHYVSLITGNDYVYSDMVAEVVDVLGVGRYERVRRDEVPRPPPGVIMAAWRPGRLALYLDRLYMYEGATIMPKLQLKIPRYIAELWAGYVRDVRVLNTVLKAREIAAYIGAFEIIRVLGEKLRWKIVHLSASVEEDAVYVYLTPVIETRTPIDIHAILQGIGGVTMIAGGVMAIGRGLQIIGTATAPAAPHIGIIAIATGITLTMFGALLLTTAAHEEPKKWYPYAYREWLEMKEKLEVAREELIAYLEQLVREGKITEEEKNRIIAYVDRIVDEAVKSAGNITEMVKKAEESVRAECKMEKIKWGLGGALVGYVLGTAAGRRVVEYIAARIPR